MAHDVFISYSAKDKTVADAVCAFLESKAARCWVAPRDILPGADWGASIVRAISGARVFVLVFSSNANASNQIKREVERAVNHGIPIIPLRIENVTPTESLEYFINTPHWLDAFNPPLEAHLAYLADVIERLIAGPDSRPPPRPPAPKPVAGANIRNISLGLGLLLLGAAGAWLASNRQPSQPPSVQVHPKPMAAQRPVAPATSPPAQPPDEAPPATSGATGTQTPPQPNSASARPIQHDAAEGHGSQVPDAELDQIYNAKGCDGLWYARNSIYAAHGKRFKTVRARNVFGSNGTIDEPVLSDAESKRAARIKAFEAEKGCR